MAKRLVVGAVLAGGVLAARRLAQTNGAARTEAEHASETEAAYRDAGTRILILGGGFGGLSTALELDRRLDQRSDVSVLVVDRDNNLLFTPLLWTVADGRSSPSSVVVPIRAFQRGRRFHLLHAEVERIDLDAREVHTSAGSRPYDRLVVALGSHTAMPELPGLVEHAHQFHTPADALEMRNHVIDALEAAHHVADPEERRAWLTFVVAGGGDTGIEVAATIHEYVASALLPEYPWLVDTPIRVVVVGRADRLVPMASRRTSDTVRRTLEAEGIEVWTGAAVQEVTAALVRTSRGDIPARTIFWAAGITAPTAVRALSVEHAPNGSVVVDDHLRVPDRPEVFVVGDASWAFDAETRDAVPPTAQAAEHQGEYVAATIAAGLHGQQTPPFRFRTKGRLALLGRRTGVAELFGVTIRGLPAWLLWHGYYLSHIPSWRNRLRLLADWLLAAVTGRETGQLRLR